MHGHNVHFRHHDGHHHDDHHHDDHHHDHDHHDHDHHDHDHHDHDHHDHDGHHHDGHHHDGHHHDGHHHDGHHEESSDDDSSNSSNAKEPYNSMAFVAGEEIPWPGIIDFVSSILSDSGLVDKDEAGSGCRRQGSKFGCKRKGQDERGPGCRGPGCKGPGCRRFACRGPGCMAAGGRGPGGRGPGCRGPGCMAAGGRGGRGHGFGCRSPDGCGRRCGRPCNNTPNQGEITVSPLLETKCRREIASAQPSPVDVFDTPEAYIIVASIPGVSPSNVNVDFDHKLRELTISGEVGASLANRGQEFRNNHLKVNERIHGKFERKIGFPEEPDVDEENITAKFSNGLLKVSIPKFEPSPVMKTKVAVGVDSDGDEDVVDTATLAEEKDEKSSTKTSEVSEDDSVFVETPEEN